MNLFYFFFSKSHFSRFTENFSRDAPRCTDWTLLRHTVAFLRPLQRHSGACCAAQIHFYASHRCRRDVTFIAAHTSRRTEIYRSAPARPRRGDEGDPEFSRLAAKFIETSLSS